MKTKIRWLVLLMIIQFFSLSQLAYAESLPPGIIIGDSDGITVDGTGEYYIDKDDIYPGETFTKTIKLMNTEEGDRPYQLEMMIAPTEKEGVINFYQAIEMSIVLAGKVIYQGDLAGKGTPDSQTSRLNLGTYAYGEFSEMEITFKVAKDLPSEMWQSKSTAKVRWDFYATKKAAITPPKKPPNKYWGLLPQTGEEWRSLLYKVITGIFIICVVLLYSKKRRQNANQETNQ